MTLKSALRSLLYQAEKLAQRIRFASLPAPQDGWPILLGISFPKSGTHLLDQILLGFSRVAPFSRRLHSFFAGYEGESGRKRSLRETLGWGQFPRPAGCRLRASLCLGRGRCSCRHVCFCTLPCNITYRGNFKNNCVAEPYQHGEFAYWESSETYPCIPEVWGEVTGQPIRHHKFPDCKISPHFETFRLNRNDPKYNFYLKDKILPIGVSINAEDIKQALFNAVNLGFISDEERKSICGYRIVRSNMFGNESIIDKGILYDVWSYRDNVYKTGKNILYANYPYNDRNNDPFLLSKIIRNRKV